MISNRSVPEARVIPVLAYEDAREAADWLCRAFGFEVRLRIADHRVQLVYGGRAVVVTGGGGGSAVGHSILVRVEDVDAHHVLAAAAGARIGNPPAWWRGWISETPSLLGSTSAAASMSSSD